MATYTIYSDTADGYIVSSSSTYSTARNGTGTVAADSSASYIAPGQVYSGGNYNCYQTFLAFDTSGVAGIITSATLNLYAYSNDSDTDFTTRARMYDWGASLTSADFVAGGSLSALTEVANWNSSAYSASYNTFTDVALPAHINQSGTTRMVLSSSRQEGNNTPSGREYVTFYSANATGTTNDPYLYIVASSAIGRSFGAIFG